jgi:hypothetical protein
MFPHSAARAVAKKPNEVYFKMRNEKVANSSAEFDCPAPRGVFRKTDRTRQGNLGMVRHDRSAGDRLSRERTLGTPSEEGKLGQAPGSPKNAALTASLNLSFLALKRPLTNLLHNALLTNL